VTGPLAAYSSGFGEELLGQGYTPESAQRQVNLMAHVSRWLESQGLSASELEPDRVVGFLKARRAEGYTLELSERAVRPLLGYLRGLAVVPTPPGPVPSTAVERLLAEYRCYLVSERGLAGTSVCAYLRTAMLFLSACEQQGGPDLEHLTAAHVTDFVVKECPRRQVAAAKVLVTGLRSLLRFLFFAGHTPRELAPAVPARSGWGQASLPRALGPEAVTALLASCDRRTAVGLRDFAVLTVLSRLAGPSGLADPAP
jgi:hypothetical protein